MSVALVRLMLPMVGGLAGTEQGKKMDRVMRTGNNIEFICGWFGYNIICTGYIMLCYSKYLERWIRLLLISAQLRVDIVPQMLVDIELKVSTKTDICFAYYIH